MKSLIIILVSLVSIFSSQAQRWSSPIPETRMSIGMGTGYGSGANTGAANLQVELNVARARLAYNQTAFFSSSKPVLFELRGGYQIGHTVSVTPHGGWAYALFNVDRGECSTYATYGAEIDIEMNEYNSSNPKIYFDYNRVGHYGLFILGFKASL